MENKNKVTLKAVSRELRLGIKEIWGEFIILMRRYKIESYLTLIFTTLSASLVFIFMLIDLFRWPLIQHYIKFEPHPGADFVDFMWYLSPIVNFVLVPIGLLGFAFAVYEICHRGFGPIIGLVDGVELEERIGNVDSIDNDHELLSMILSANIALEDTNKDLLSEVKETKHQREKEGAMR